MLRLQPGERVLVTTRSHIYVCRAVAPAAPNSPSQVPSPAAPEQGEGSKLRRSDFGGVETGGEPEVLEVRLIVLNQRERGALLCHTQP